MQNAMPSTMKRSTSKPEVEFKYGGRPYSENGRSNNSALKLDISSKFDVQIGFYSPRITLSYNRTPKTGWHNFISNV